MKHTRVCCELLIYQRTFTCPKSKICCIICCWSYYLSLVSISHIYFVLLSLPFFRILKLQFIVQNGFRLWVVQVQVINEWGTTSITRLFSLTLKTPFLFHINSLIIDSSPWKILFLKEKWMVSDWLFFQICCIFFTSFVDGHIISGFLCLRLVIDDTLDGRKNIRYALALYFESMQKLT